MPGGETVAKGYKTGGRDFQPGNDWAGVRKKTPEFQAFEGLKGEEFKWEMWQIVDLPVSDLKLILEDKRRYKVRHRIMARFLLEMEKKADPTRYALLLDRLLGKQTQRIEAQVRASLEDLVTASEGLATDENGFLEPASPLEDDEPGEI